MSSTFHAQNPAAYQKMMGRWSELLAAKLLQTLPSLPTGKILDVGCGTGSLIAPLLKVQGITQIHGIDYSANYVAAAKERFSGDRHVVIEQADACSLPFEDNTFDAVYSLLVLKFVSDPAQTIREMARVVRPGGNVIAVVWYVYGGFLQHRLFWDIAALVLPECTLLREKALWLPVTKAKELKPAFEAIGLKNTVPFELSIRIEFDNFDDYWNPLEGGDGLAGQFVSSLSASKRDLLRQAIRNSYIAGRSDGPRSLVATAVAVSSMSP